MRILSVGSAFPENLYPQAVITGAIKQHWGERLEHPELLERLHSRAESNSATSPFQLSNTRASRTSARPIGRGWK